MTKPEAMADAKRYADMIRQTIYVQRRGDEYIASSLMKPGYRMAEIVHPTNN